MSFESIVPTAIMSVFGFAVGAVFGWDRAKNNRMSDLDKAAWTLEGDRATAERREENRR